MSPLTRMRGWRRWAPLSRPRPLSPVPFPLPPRASSSQDTFYLETAGDEDPLVLRTHTSAVQIRALERMKPPLAIVAPGRVYRRDTPDATHNPEFHQVRSFPPPPLPPLAPLFFVDSVRFCDGSGGARSRAEIVGVSRRGSEVIGVLERESEVIGVSRRESRSFGL